MRFHLIAVGGSIMHNLAIELQRRGHIVTGSDDIIYEPALSLLQKNNLLPPSLGWFPEKITPEIDQVIVGNHAKADNPEWLKAKELGIPFASFPQFIYEHAKHKHRIVIAGSHGKTTVTAMIAHVLKNLPYPADYLIGSRIQGFENMVHLSDDAPIFLMEGDEYLTAPFDPRPKFMVYKPHLLVLTGIAWDHINAFPTEALYIQQFDNLLASLEKATHIIYNDNDKTLKNLIKKYQKIEHLYFIPYTALPSKTINNQLHAKIENHIGSIQVFGEHNLSNLSAAYEVCKLLSISPYEFLTAIASFKGASKRLEIIYQDQWNTIISDFAHSPSKVQASLHAVANHFKKLNLIAVLELHTFSSLNKNFIKNYKGIFKKIKHKFVFIDKPIVENKRMPLLTPEEIKEAFQDPHIIVCYDKDALLKHLRSVRKDSNVFLFMSSGDFAGLNKLDVLA